jgi:D-alanyl-D-alanine dipeptidase
VPQRAANRLRNGLIASAALAAVCVASDASAFDPFLITPSADIAERSPAYRYANASDADAIAELERVEQAPGVRAPIRLTGRLHGVHFHSSLPPEQRVTSPFEILDARLALALDDFAAVLERHGIDEVIHYTMYRPNVAPPTTPAASATATTATSSAPSSAKPPRSKSSKNAKPQPVAARGTTSRRPASTSATPAAIVAPVSELHHPSWAPPGTRHPAGLAIDVGVLHEKSGRFINIGAKFHGAIGEKTCGDGVRVPEDADGRELRVILCEAASLGIFTYVLTPNYNAAHADHFHMEVKPGVRWFLIH